MILFWIRCFLLTLIIMLLVTLVLAELDSWSSSADHWTILGRIHQSVNDMHYNVPPNDRAPKESIREFYQKQLDFINRMTTDTRKAFPRQEHLPGPMQEGFHAGLPDTMMWKKGVIVIGDHVRRERERARQT